MGTESIEQESKTSKTVKSTKNATKLNQPQSVPPPQATPVAPIAVTPSLPPTPPLPYTPQEYRAPEPASLKSTKNTQNREKFNHNDPKYQCCCGCMHYKTATLTVGIVECVLITALAIGLLITGFRGIYAWKTIAIILIVNAFFYVPVFISFFVGYCKKDWHLFIPYCVMACIRILLTLVWSFFVIYATANPGNIISNLYVHGVVWIALLFLFLILQVWWIYIINKCSKYFIAYENILNGSAFKNEEEERGF